MEGLFTVRWDGDPVVLRLKDTSASLFGPREAILSEPVPQRRSALQLGRRYDDHWDVGTLM